MLLCYSPFRRDQRRCHVCEKDAYVRQLILCPVYESWGHRSGLLERLVAIVALPTIPRLFPYRVRR